MQGKRILLLLVLYVCFWALLADAKTIKKTVILYCKGIPPTVDNTQNFAGAPEVNLGMPCAESILDVLSASQASDVKWQVQVDSSDSKSGRIVYTLTETENLSGSERSQKERSLLYASLSPRNYRFFVRSMNVSDASSVKPASVDFVILEPIWLRWWFLILSVITTALLIHSIYRIRTNRQLEIERLRTRIASDLHDDIGSSLSRIAVLSDAVCRKVNGDADVLPLLSNMAQASREAIDAMGDIVWAVNPKKDQLQDLESRMRRLAGEMLAERNMKFDCSPSSQQESYTLNPNLKRNMFLIFKESLHNIVRHSNASNINIRLDLNNGNLLLKVQDNGRGFDTSEVFEGHGLRNMERRAAELNGSLKISSKPHDGTSIRLQAPLT